MKNRTDHFKYNLMNYNELFFVPFWHEDCIKNNRAVAEQRWRSGTSLIGGQYLTSIKAIRSGFVMNQQVVPTQDAGITDGALAHRIIQGQRVAEIELYRRYQPKLSRMLNTVTSNPADAADIHQEVLRIVIEKLRAGELRDKNKLSSFVLQVGRYQTLGYYRKQSKLQLSDDIESYIDPDTNDPVRSQYRTMVREVIDSMTQERDRHILYLFYIQEREKHEICHNLALTSLHFDRVLFRARQRFKTKWLNRVECPA